MTIMLRAQIACLMTGLLLTLAPAAGAQAVGGMAPVSHVELSAKVRVAGFAAPVDIRQSGAKTRVDLTASGMLQSYIADREKGVLISLTTTGQSRTALVFPLDRAEGVVPLPLDLSVLVRQATLKVVGVSMVGGRPCRLIEFSNYLSQSGLLCASPENVILQMTKKGQNKPLFEILELSMGAQDPKWFRAPPDYQIAVVPAIGGASAQGGDMVTQPQPPGVSVKMLPAR